MKDVEAIIERGRARRAFRADPGFGRLLRCRAGLTQAEVASLLSVRPSAVSRWERGQRTPQGDLLDRYRELLARLEAA